MADGLWSYPDTVGRLDLTGFEVAAVDGDIGKIDEATHDVDASYFVVDTGMWIFGKKVLLPAGLIDRVDRDDEKVYVDRTKEEIENAPEFDKDNYQGDAYRSEVGGYYGSRTEEAEAERETEEERISDRS